MATMLDGVSIAPRRVIAGAQGEVRHVLKNTDPEFSGDVLPFGEVYASVVYPGVPKDWKLHTQSTSRMSVLVGMVKFVLCDKRETSITFGQFQEVVLGERMHGLLLIPQGIAYTWKNLWTTESMILNIATHPHDPLEAKSIPLSEIPFGW